MKTEQGRQRSLRRNSSKWLVLLLCVAFTLYLVYTRNNEKPAANEPPYTPTIALNTALQVPAIKPADQIIKRTGFTLCYDAAAVQARWVAYVLRGFQIKGESVERADDFMVDPQARPHSADNADYSNSGYDRGHLASAEDMSWSVQSMKESFYYSNASPQIPVFNRGVWKRLEELLRYWAEAYDSIYVVTGPVLSSGLPAIGHDKVSVPHLFYKAVLVYNGKGVQGIGFVLRNEASAATLRNFSVSVDSVEHLTGIDFFPKMPDDVEEKVESRLNENDWLWTRKRQNN